MQHVNREDFLQRLESVSPGVGAKGIAQTECIAFSDGQIITFSGELKCQIPLPEECADLVGAVPAAPLLLMLRKFSGDDVRLSVKKGHLRLLGEGGERSGIRIDEKILLPFDSVEQPENWHPLHKDFCAAIGIVAICANKADKRFQCQCLHLTPELIEATDNMQICKYEIETGVKRSVMIKKESIGHIAQLGMTKYAETRGWLHFRNKAKLQVSCRRHTNEWIDISEYFEMPKGAAWTLPGALGEGLEKAQEFAVASGEEMPLVRVDLEKGTMRLHGEGPVGFYMKEQKTDYKGKPTSFKIPPLMLADIAKRHTRCEIGEDRMKVDGGKFIYIAMLQVDSENSVTVE